MVVVEGKDKDLLTSSRGEWWRVLLPGTHRVWAHKGSWRSPIVEVVVKEAKEEEQGVGARSEERRVAQRRVVHSHGAQDHDQEGHTQKHSGEAWDHVDLHLVSSVSVLDDQTIFQTEPYIPEPRVDYPPPPPPITDLERKFEGPLLSQAWKVLASPGPLGLLGLPYLADPGLLLQELVAPALHNFSLSSTELQVGCL